MINKAQFTKKLPKFFDKYWCIYYNIISIINDL